MPEYTSVPAGYKVCNNRDNCIHPDGPVLPNTTEYFGVNRATPDGFERKCKVCVKAKHWKRNVPPPPVPDGYKYCSLGDKCVHPDGPTLSLAEFHKDKSHKDGLRSLCKKCTYQYHIEHREEVAVLQREYYARNAEAERSKQRGRRLADPEKHRAASRRYWWKNVEKSRAENRKACAKYREIRWQNAVRKAAKRRATKANAEGTHTPEDLTVIYEAQHGRCLYCGTDLNGCKSLDHFIPLDRGGTNYKWNLAYACKSCNSSKHNVAPWNWYKWNGAYPVFWNGRLL